LDLGSVLYDLGTSLTSGKRPSVTEENREERGVRRTKARSCFERARANLEQLVSVNPHAVELRRDLAEAHLCCAKLERDADDYAQAVENVVKAEAICLELVHSDPADTRSQQLLAEILIEAGVVQRSLGNRDGALDFLEQALVIWTRLAGDHPAIGAFRTGLARSRQEREKLESHIADDLTTNVQN
jgi:tetratricopeptide (TPR) repeat protein